MFAPATHTNAKYTEYSDLLSATTPGVTCHSWRTSLDSTTCKALLLLRSLIMVIMDIMDIMDIMESTTCKALLLLLLQMSCLSTSHLQSCITSHCLIWSTVCWDFICLCSSVLNHSRLDYLVMVTCTCYHLIQLADLLQYKVQLVDNEIDGPPWWVSWHSGWQIVHTSWRRLPLGRWWARSACGARPLWPSDLLHWSTRGESRPRTPAPTSFLKIQSQISKLYDQHFWYRNISGLKIAISTTLRLNSITFEAAGSSLDFGLLLSWVSSNSYPCPAKKPSIRS